MVHTSIPYPIFWRKMLNVEIAIIDDALVVKNMKRKRFLFYAPIDIKES